MTITKGQKEKIAEQRFKTEKKVGLHLVVEFNSTGCY